MTKNTPFGGFKPIQRNPSKKNQFWGFEGYFAKSLQKENGLNGIPPKIGGIYPLGGVSAADPG